MTLPLPEKGTIHCEIYPCQLRKDAPMKFGGFILAAALAIIFEMPLHAQGGEYVVTLSPLVGPSIDRIEAQRYRLFSQMEGFDSAIVCRVADGRFVVLVSLLDANGITKDTALEYSEATLERVAEKINHFDQIVSGDYIQGSDIPHLVETPMSDQDVARRLSGAWLLAQKQLKVQGQSGAERGRRPLSREFPREPSAAVSDLLPFSGEGELPPEESFPQFGFGGGLTSYNTDFTGVEQAFRAIEDYYRAKGYSVSSPGHDFDVSFGWLASLVFRFSPAISLQFDVGKGINTALDKFDAVSGSVLYHFNFEQLSALHLFVGAGLSHFHFEGGQGYGDMISEVNSQGGYYLLERINTAGGGYGYPLTVGIDLNPAARTALRFSSTYVIASTINATSGSTQNGSVSLGGLAFGLHLLLYP